MRTHIKMISALTNESWLSCDLSTYINCRFYIIIALAEPQIVVRGGQELHVKEGSTLNLTCEISGYPKAIHYVTWYKDDKVRVRPYRSAQDHLIFLFFYIYSRCTAVNGIK